MKIMIVGCPSVASMIVKAELMLALSKWPEVEMVHERVDDEIRGLKNDFIVIDSYHHFDPPEIVWPEREIETKSKCKKHRRESRGW